MHPLPPFQKGVVGLGVEKGCYYLWHKKNCVLQFESGFCSFVPPKAFFFKILLLFCLVFFFFFSLLFLFRLPFQIYIMTFFFFFINPFWENIIVLFILLFLFFPFPFLICISFKQISWHPLFKLKLLSFWLFDSSVVVLIVLVFIFRVSLICLFCLFLFRLLFCFQIMTNKRCFPCNSGVWCVRLVQNQSWSKCSAYLCWRPKIPPPPQKKKAKTERVK